VYEQWRRRRRRTLFSLELPETESPTFCEADFSLCGCALEPSESAVPLNLSPRCSVVDFSESGLSAAPALSVRLWRPAAIETDQRRSACGEERNALSDMIDRKGGRVVVGGVVKGRV
jgi:hypothetical protein